MTDTAEASPSLGPDPYALYRYFDGSEVLLYVGKSGDIAVRNSAHIRRSDWMQFAARSAIERYGTPDAVGDAEREAIETEHPIFNKQYNDTPEARRQLCDYLEGVGRLDLLPPIPQPLLTSERSEWSRSGITRAPGANTGHLNHQSAVTSGRANGGADAMTRWSHFRYIAIPIAAVVALVIFLVHTCAPPADVTGDFRDPAVLARAIEVAAQKAGDGTPGFSSCAQAVFPKYVCTVGFSGGTVATYNVEVATDGSWWHTA